MMSDERETVGEKDRMTKPYLEIVAHYEYCLENFGDTHLGVDWPNETDAEKRYGVMLDGIRNRTTLVDLLDFGCGTSHLYEYILRRKIRGINYSGLDLSAEFVRHSKKKFPTVPYYCLDILDENTSLPQFDYIVMNGVFTVKRSLSFNEMFAYFKKVIRAVYPYVKSGMAFNVMSSHVDWQRDDLFHLPLDTLADFIIDNFGRTFVIRNDYGLYEYTVYLYRKP